MIIKCSVPSSRKMRRQLRAAKRTVIAPQLTAMWGRASSPGLSKLSANYRARSV